MPRHCLKPTLLSRLRRNLSPVFSLCPVLVTLCRLSVGPTVPPFLTSNFSSALSFYSASTSQLLPFTRVYFPFTLYVFHLYSFFFFFFRAGGGRFYRLYCLWSNQTDVSSSLSHCLVTLLVLFSRQVMSNSFSTSGLWPTRLFCPLDFPGKHTGVGCHFLLQGIFPTQGLNPRLMYWQADSLPLSHHRNKPLW